MKNRRLEKLCLSMLVVLLIGAVGGGSCCVWGEATLDTSYYQSIENAMLTSINWIPLHALIMDIIGVSTARAQGSTFVLTSRDWPEDLPGGPGTLLKASAGGTQGSDQIEAVLEASWDTQRCTIVFQRNGKPELTLKEWYSPSLDPRKAAAGMLVVTVLFEVPEFPAKQRMLVVEPVLSDKPGPIQYAYTHTVGYEQFSFTTAPFCAQGDDIRRTLLLVHEAVRRLGLNDQILEPALLGAISDLGVWNAEVALVKSMVNCDPNQGGSPEGKWWQWVLSIVVTGAADVLAGPLGPEVTAGVATANAGVLVGAREVNSGK